MLKVNNKSCEQKQVTFITAAQRAAHWWKCGTNGKCEWICEEHRELFMELSNCRRYPTLRERDIKAFYYRTKRSILSKERYFLRYFDKKRRSEDIS